MVVGVRKSVRSHQLDHRAAQPELGGQRQVGGGGADLHADPPGLDDAPDVRADVGQLLGGEPERDGPALAGLEPDPPEAAQLADRAGDRRLLVTHVELDHLVAGTLTGVGDVDADRHRVAGGRELRPVKAEPSTPKVVYERPNPNGHSGATGAST